MIAPVPVVKVKSSSTVMVKLAPFTVKVPLTVMSDPAPTDPAAVKVAAPDELWLKVVPAAIVTPPPTVVPPVTEVVPVELAGLATTFALKAAVVPAVTEKFAAVALCVIAPLNVAVVPELSVKLPDPAAVVMVPATAVVKEPPASIRTDPVPLFINGALIARVPVDGVLRMQSPLVIVTGPLKVDTDPPNGTVEKSNVFPTASKIMLPVVAAKVKSSAAAITNASLPKRWSRCCQSWFHY